MLYVLSALLLGSLASVNGLTCNEGFNASISGIPLFHWDQNTCNGKSKCFSQELEVSIENIDVTMRYGGCVSKAYASYLTCDNLFGPKSKLDPALLLNLIPDLDGKFKRMANSFATDTIKQLHLLMSSGKGSEDFISGIIQFMENLGFNMEQVEKLQTELAKTFELMFIPPNPYAMQQVHTAVKQLMDALEKLDTADEQISDDIYKFVSNYYTPDELKKFKESHVYSTLIERLPGLVKSTLPPNWRSYAWFGAMFEMLGEVKFADPRQTVKEMLYVLEATYEPYTMFTDIDLEYYLYPIYDSLPELVGQLVDGNGSYASYWSVQLLKTYSVTNNATENLDKAFRRFLTGVDAGDLSEDLETLIKWLPGFFYQLFPAENSEISKAYQTMADGFNTFNFADWDDTAEETELSEFILLLEKKLGGSSSQQLKTYVVNFSHMFYTLLPEYNSELDIFFKTLSEGFKNYPDIDTGKIISLLVTNLGGEIPVELKPFLDNMKGVVDSFMEEPIDINDFYTSATKLINAYKKAFPDSEFPDLIQRYINIIKGSNDGTIPAEEVQEMTSDWTVDYAFALFDAFNFESDEVLEAFEDAFPIYGAYVKMMETLEPGDVKELARSYVKWLMHGLIYGGATSEGFVKAMKPAFEKITAKLVDVTSLLRQLFAPDSCEYNACEFDLCNGHKIQGDIAFLPNLRLLMLGKGNN